MAQDYTVRIFDQFYNLDLVVNASEYEIIFSYFKQNLANDTEAKVFTEILFRISNITEIPVLDLFQTFQSSNSSIDKLTISRTMAYYLNSVSNKTVLFGVNNIVSPNQSVSRNIFGGNPYEPPLPPPPPPPPPAVTSIQLLPSSGEYNIECPCPIPTFTHLIRVIPVAQYYTQIYPAPQVFHDIQGVSTNGASFSLTPDPQIPELIDPNAQYGNTVNSPPPATAILSDLFGTMFDPAGIYAQNQDVDLLLPQETDPTISTSEVDMCSINPDNPISPTSYSLLLNVGDSLYYDVSGSASQFTAVFGAACYSTDFGFITESNFTGYLNPYSFKLLIGPDMGNCQVYLCENLNGTGDLGGIFQMTRLPNIGTYPG